MLGCAQDGGGLMMLHPEPADAGLGGVRRLTRREVTCNAACQPAIRAHARTSPSKENRIMIHYVSLAIRYVSHDRAVRQPFDLQRHRRCTCRQR